MFWMCEECNDRVMLAEILRLIMISENVLPKLVLPCSIYIPRKSSVAEVLFDYAGKV